MVFTDTHTHTQIQTQSNTVIMHISLNQSDCLAYLHMREQLTKLEETDLITIHKLGLTETPRIRVLIKHIYYLFHKHRNRNQQRRLGWRERNEGGRNLHHHLEPIPSSNSACAFGEQLTFTSHQHEPPMLPKPTLIQTATPTKDVYRNLTIQNYVFYKHVPFSNLERPKIRVIMQSNICPPLKPWPW